MSQHLSPRPQGDPGLDELLGLLDPILITSFASATTSTSSSSSTSVPTASTSITPSSFPTLSPAEKRKHVRKARDALQSAYDERRSSIASLVKAQYPTIAAHIRQANHLTTKMETTLSSVHALDTSMQHFRDQSSSSSIIPILHKHFTAARKARKAARQAESLKALRSATEDLRTLEEDVYAGRGSLEPALSQLQPNGSITRNGGGSEFEAVVFRSITTHRAHLRSIVIEQMLDAFNRSVSFANISDTHHEATITIQSSILVQTTSAHSRITNHRSQTTTPSLIFPMKHSESRVGQRYSLPEVLLSMKRLGILGERIQALQDRLFRHFIRPLLIHPPDSGSTQASLTITESSNDELSILRITTADSIRIVEAILDDVLSILKFVLTKVFPAHSDYESHRNQFVNRLLSMTFKSVLEDLILPSIPQRPSDLDRWIESVKYASTCEETIYRDFGVGGVPATNVDLVFPTFLEYGMSAAWVTKQEELLLKDIKRLVDTTWIAWESEEKHRSTSVTVLVEVDATEDPVAPTSENTAAGGATVSTTATATSASDGWDIDLDDAEDDAIVEGDDGWGFEEEQHEKPTAPTSMAPPSTEPEPTPTLSEGGNDGWDFEDVTPSSAPIPPIPQIPMKPAREAKRLGKKANKLKHDENSDSFDFTDSASEDVMAKEEDDAKKVAEIDRAKAKDDMLAREKAEEEARKRDKEEANAKAKMEAEVKMKKVLKEKSVQMDEVYRVSTACDTLLHRLRVYVDDMEATRKLPQLSQAVPCLCSGLINSLDVLRATLPSLTLAKVSDIPGLIIQLVNDFIYLSDSIPELAKRISNMSNQPDQPEALLLRTLKSTASKYSRTRDKIFNDFIHRQREILVGFLNETHQLVETSNDVIFKKCKESMSQLSEHLMTASFVIKDVAPKSMYLDLFGKLVTFVLDQIIHDILALADITEVESTRLHELMEILVGLEQLFTAVEGDEKSSIALYVHNWFKFCYVNEILSANLADITFLYVSGALVDFSPTELVGLVTALFSESPKRQAVVDMVSASRVKDDSE